MSPWDSKNDNHERHEEHEVMDGDIATAGRAVNDSCLKVNMGKYRFLGDLGVYKVFNSSLNQLGID